jgi:hypothetical protein
MWKIEAEIAFERGEMATIEVSTPTPTFLTVPD